MAAEPYFFNLTTRQWVNSVSQPTQIAGGFPVWSYGDTREISVTFVQAEPNAKVSVVQTISAVTVAIGTPGVAALTSATAGTPSASFAYPITIPLALSAINTYLGSSLTRNATIEFRIATATGTARYKSQIVLEQWLATDTVTDPVAPLVALTTVDAPGIYLAKQVPKGTRLIWIDEETDQVYTMGFKNGQLLAELQ